MKRLVVVTALAVALTAGLSRAQFGFGITVFDPSVFAKVAAQLVEMEKQLTQLVNTYRRITDQYNHMLYMARRIPVNMALRYRAMATPWRYPSASNTYGTTGGWIGAVNSGANVASGYLAAAERLLAYGAAMANVPADQRDRLTKHYATIELTDGANQHGLEAMGLLRRNAAQVETAIQGLEEDSLSSNPDYNTEVGVLNKINAATVIALRNGQDANKLLVALAEQQVLEAKRQRDAEAQAINNHIALMRQGRTVIQQQSGGWTAAILGYRL